MQLEKNLKLFDHKCSIQRYKEEKNFLVPEENARDFNITKLKEF